MTLITNIAMYKLLNYYQPEHIHLRDSDDAPYVQAVHDSGWIARDYGDVVRINHASTDYLTFDEVEIAASLRDKWREETLNEAIDFWVTINALHYAPRLLMAQQGRAQVLSGLKDLKAEIDRCGFDWDTCLNDIKER